MATVAGNPFVEIVRYAKEHTIDLIVIGTHGRGPVAHMLLGQRGGKGSPQSTLSGADGKKSRARVRDAVKTMNAE